MAKTYFHGTKAELNVGDHIVPATVHGKGSVWGNFGDMDGQASREHAFAASDWHTAQYFAKAAETESHHGLNGHIFEVEPVGTPKKGKFYDRDNREFTAKAWRIVSGPHYGPPVKKGYSRQAMLPIDFAQSAENTVQAKNREGRAAYLKKGQAETPEEMLHWRNKASEAWNEGEKILANAQRRWDPAKKMKPRQFAEQKPEKPAGQVKGQMRLF
jgi:hypothetical protein